MGGTTALIPNGDEEFPASEGCPRCGEPWGSLPPLVTSLFPGEPLLRCTRCGTRTSLGPEQNRHVRTCERCGVPYLDEVNRDDKGGPCPDCAEGRIPTDLPDSEMAQATESEVTRALGRAWSFVTMPKVAAYLDGIARRVAARIDGAPETTRVLLIEESSLRTFTLPSGTLMLSLGMLASLEDEAELAFVLGHELTHAASGDAAGRLVRLGLHAVARDEQASAGKAWAEAAVDLMRLGYGRERERQADAGAMRAILALGYDPESVTRFLSRIDSRIGDGDPKVQEFALAHPTPASRRRRATEAAQRGPDRDVVPRVNRELFRRAVGRDVLSTEWVRLEGLDVASTRPLQPGWWARYGIPLAGILLLAILLAIFGSGLLR